MEVDRTDNNYISGSVDYCTKQKKKEEEEKK